MIERLESRVAHVLNELSNTKWAVKNKVALPKIQLMCTTTSASGTIMHMCEPFESSELIRNGVTQQARILVGQILSELVLWKHYCSRLKAVLTGATQTTWDCNFEIDSETGVLQVKCQEHESRRRFASQAHALSDLFKYQVEQMAAWDANDIANKYRQPDIAEERPPVYEARDKGWLLCVSPSSDSLGAATDQKSPPTPESSEPE